MKQNNVKGTIVKGIVTISKKMASVDANTACPWIGFQPEQPKKVKDLRKF